MKKNKVLLFSILVLFFSIFIFKTNLNSRSVFTAPQGHHWLTPTGGCSEDGIPKKKATQDENGLVDCGGCDPAPGLCWEVKDDGDTLIIYDLVISNKPPELGYIFIPVPD